jgi:hypothetical protein
MPATSTIPDDIVQQDAVLGEWPLSAMPINMAYAKLPGTPTGPH